MLTRKTEKSEEANALLEFPFVLEIIAVTSSEHQQSYNLMYDEGNIAWLVIIERRRLKRRCPF